MDFLGDYTLRVVALGSGVLGAAAGALGSFAYLRRQSLVGDALSHAALPGIAIVFLLTGSKAPLPIMLGAALAGWIATLAVRLVVRRSRVPYDSALGMALAVFFGFGLVLLTWIQKRPDAAQAGLESFLFGQAASLLREDVVAMTILGAACLVVLALLWKEFKLLSFDTEFGESLGRPMRRLDGLFTLLLVVAVVIGLRTVGCGAHVGHGRGAGCRCAPVDQPARAHGHRRRRHRCLLRGHRRGAQFGRSASADRADHRPRLEHRGCGFAGLRSRSADCFGAGYGSVGCSRQPPSIRS